MKYIIGVFSAVLWGLNFVFTKYLLDYMSPYEIVVYRYGLSGLFFLAILLFMKSQINIKLMNKEDGFKIIMAAILGVAVYPLLACFSVKYISVSLAGILNGSIPLITILGERIFRKTKLTYRIMFAVILSLLGIVILSGKSDINQSPVLGTVLMIAALVAWVAFTFINETLFEKYSELELLTYESLIGAALLIPFVAYSQASISRQVQLMGNPVVVLNMVVLAIGISSMGYLCYMYGLKHLGVGFMSFVMNLLPVFTVISAFILSNEKIGPLDIVGLVLITLSVLVARSRTTKDDEQVCIESEDYL